MSAYADFLASKAIIVRPSGRDVDPSEIHPSRFAHQRDLIRWQVRKGRAACFAATGLGKAGIAIEACRLTGQRALIFTPLGVVQQFVEEGARLGVDVRAAREQADANPIGITVTNYDRLHLFDPSAFGCVALDECFPPGTLVDVPGGRKKIEECIIGDEILNATGTDVVSDVHRREVPHAVRITVNGQAITSSPNHPYFTQRGWVAAQDLAPGDHVLATGAAVRLVWSGIHSEAGAEQASTILRNILLSEMADEPARARRQSSHTRGAGEAQRAHQGVVCVRGSRGRGESGANSHAESNIRSGGTSQDLPPVESHEARTFRAWGQRTWFDGASTDLTGCARTNLGGGIQFVTGQTDSRLSHALQARLSQSRAENRYRSGWILAQQSASSGHQKGCSTDFARVDCLEILEPGHPDLERLRDADGKLYFYDLGATRHPSFSVNGLLVHNSSCLKHEDARIRQRLTDACREIPFRFAYSATPAPNDHAELANHAEFLGVMDRGQVLATFFVHANKSDGSKGQEWRLKGHARSAFYEWLASWGMSLKRPSDLGYDDAGYDLPDLSIRPVIVRTDWVRHGELFATELKGIQDRAAVRKATLAERARAAADLILAEPGEQWIAWVGLNDEGRELAKLVPGAVVIEGSDSPEHKVEAMRRFKAGEIRALISKVSIFGFGLNLQQCARMVFVGLSDSYEAYHQAIRRCWRFGQARPVHAYVVLTEPEQVIYANVLRKEREFEQMTDELVMRVADFERRELDGIQRPDDLPHQQRTYVPAWLQGVA